MVTPSSTANSKPPMIGAGGCCSALGAALAEPKSRRLPTPGTQRAAMEARAVRSPTCLLSRHSPDGQSLRVRECGGGLPVRSWFEKEEDVAGEQHQVDKACQEVRSPLAIGQHRHQERQHQEYGAAAVNPERER